MKRKYIITFAILIFMVSLSFIYTIATKEQKTAPYNDKTAQFIQQDPTKVVGNLVNKKQGMYYFGFPTCPWCLELLPVLDTELEQAQTTAYIVNTRADNYTKNEDLLLNEFYKKYTKDKDLSVPFVVAINSSQEVKVHVGTLKVHDASKNKMSNKQKQKLSSLLNEFISFSIN